MTCTLLRTEFAIRWHLPLLFIGLAASIVPSAYGQGTPAASTPQQNEAERSASASDVRFSIETNSRFGNFTYVPEQWGELHLQLENRGNTARELNCATYFNVEQSLQFGRQVWLPANSKLCISHPVLMPQADQFEDQTARLHSLVIDRTGGNEILLKTASGQLRHERSLLITTTDRNTGILAGWNPEELTPQDVVDLVVASRVSQSMNNKATILGGQFLPADETSLNYLDHMVIAENRLTDDVAALTAVRRWLHAGGRLWIMLDRTDPRILEGLLGDDFAGRLVDRVSLTSVRIDKAPTLAAPNGEVGQTVDYDEPVEMTRMVVSGMKIWNTVHGWPAAMSCSYGDGRLLITTLGARGWIKSKTELKDKGAVVAAAPGTESAYVPNSPMEDLSAYLLGKREPGVLPPVALESIAQEHISYKVPTWTLIVGTMGGFLVSLFAAALFLKRMDCLEHFGWSGSLLAMVFGVVLTGIGLSNRYGVPGTMASVQLAQAISGTDDVRSHGVIAVYRPEGEQSLIQTSHGGELRPDMSGLEGSTRRMITTDLGAFHWEGLPQPAGLRLHTDVTSAAFVKRIEAQATVDAQGVVGRYIGHPATGTDALLATRNGRIGVTWAADGTFTARADDLFEADQFLNASFLGDDQDRRRRILQELFASRTWKDYLDRPQLLVWVNDWDPGFQFGEGLTRQGDTLLAVPVEMTRPQSGGELLVPSPLISYATRRPPDGSVPSGSWDDGRKEWQERSSPNTTWLSFQIPRGLLPLEATKARLQIKVSGPMNRLEILGLKSDSPVSLETVVDPVGSLAFDIADAELLQVSEQGTLSLGISAGDPARTASASAASGSTSNYWRIDSLSLQVWAKAAERSEED